MDSRITPDVIRNNNAQAAAILDRHPDTRAEVDQFNDPLTARQLEQGGVQEWSQGPIYPAVIARVETYDDGVLRHTVFELTLDGVTEAYASYDDAVAAATGLLAQPKARVARRIVAPSKGLNH